MDSFRHIIWIAIAVVLVSAPSNEQAKADSALFANLERSRDALLTQRKELQDASYRIGTQITELQRQQERVDAYLGDTDRALRNVDSALRNGY